MWRLHRIWRRQCCNHSKTVSVVLIKDYGLCIQLFDQQLSLIIRRIFAVKPTLHAYISVLTTCRSMLRRSRGAVKYQSDSYSHQLLALSSTVPSSCYLAPAAGRFGARESYYRLCVASTTSAAMRRAIETPRDTDQ